MPPVAPASVSTVPALTISAFPKVPEPPFISGAIGPLRVATAAVAASSSVSSTPAAAVSGPSVVTATETKPPNWVSPTLPRVAHYHSRHLPNRFQYNH